MDINLEKRVQAWLKEPFDTTTRDLVQKLIDTDPKELENSFYTDLVFGTGGLRGLMGVGTNRMNRYTVRKATQGLANYIKKTASSPSMSVVIGFDSRVHSEEFAKEASRVLLNNGIDVFFIKELRPTPFVSFACRHCKATAAIMITASHNPKEYNGYKVYWQDGAQIVAPHDVGILKEVNCLQDFSEAHSLPKGKLFIMGEELDKAYLEALMPLKEALSPHKEDKSSLHIVYTSLHGTGITLVPKALSAFGFSHVSLVKEQSVPDGAFPTVLVPNPEYKETLKLGLEQMMNSRADILLATDPDADRLAVAVRHHDEAVLLSGNETAALCLEYLCRTLSKNKMMPKKPAAITTIVSTDLFQAVCDKHALLCVKLLTGFKYIGEQIHLWEETKDSPSFIFGAEESYGYLYGTHARDKDSIILSCLISEMALTYKKQNKTLVDFLYEIYEIYGIFREASTSIEFPPGKEGIDKINKIMNAARKHPFTELCSIPVVSSLDFLDTAKTNLPKSDVLLFRLSDESKIIIRPSGTEPKLKIYGGVRNRSFSDLTDGIQKADNKLETILETVKTKLKSFCEI